MGGEVTEPRPLGDRIVRAVCDCGRHMTLSRFGGPQKEIHRKRSGSRGPNDLCRLIATPLASGGVHVRRVGEEEWVEDVWHELRERWERAHLRCAMVPDKAHGGA